MTMFLIEKRGLYYRPDAQGYTGLRSKAGRYTFEEAAERVGPNGPDGPQDGMCMWREEEAPKYSSRCPWDLRMKDEAYWNGYADGLKAHLKPKQEPDPDFEGFTRAVMTEWYEHFDLDAPDKFDLALKYNILKPIPGGFDPETHDCPHGYTEPGDPWYELNYSLTETS